MGPTGDRHTQFETSLASGPTTLLSKIRLKGVVQLDGYSKVCLIECNKWDFQRDIMTVEDELT